MRDSDKHGLKWSVYSVCYFEKHREFGLMSLGILFSHIPEGVAEGEDKYRLPPSEKEMEVATVCTCTINTDARHLIETSE